jgi:hypothetical protein
MFLQGGAATTAEASCPIPVHYLKSLPCHGKKLFSYSFIKPPQGNKIHGLRGLYALWNFCPMVSIPFWDANISLTNEGKGEIAAFRKGRYREERVLFYKNPNYFLQGHNAK